MAWRIIYHPDANYTIMDGELPPGLNVISPQWFRISPDGSRLTTYFSHNFVTWAQAQGVQVWPLVFDVGYDRSRAFLMNRDARRNAVDRLVHYVDALGLDGINIDFEHLRAADGPYKIQFLRELAIPLRERGAVLSAAVKVPIFATTFYRRDLIGLTVDFVQVMTYDEYWHTHTVAGPNASLPWVNTAIHNMLNGIRPETGVPADKLIMGIPFYSRIWREVPSTGETRRYRDLHMESARRFFEDRDVEWVWDPILGSYYGVVNAVEDGEVVFYRVWLVDERSIRETMHIFAANDLAGVASWALGQEAPGVWDVLSRFLTN